MKIYMFKDLIKDLRLTDVIIRLTWEMLQEKLHSTCRYIHIYFHITLVKNVYYSLTERYTFLNHKKCLLIKLWTVLRTRPKKIHYFKSKEIWGKVFKLNFLNWNWNKGITCGFLTLWFPTWILFGIQNSYTMCAYYFAGKFSVMLHKELPLCNYDIIWL